MDGRKNLISLLLEGIKSGQITPFDARLDDDFKVPMTFEQVQEAFGAEATTEETIDFDTGERKTVTIQGEIRPGEIKQYMVKEEWYFDKQASSLNVRILGICPIREYTRAEDPTGEVMRQKSILGILSRSQGPAGNKPCFESIQRSAVHVVRRPVYQTFL
jgi:hypothetical protein